MSIFISTAGMSPGPWKAELTETGNSFDIRDDFGRVIARVPIQFDFIPDSELVANMAVIAAAPELLAALREAAYHLAVAKVPLNQAYFDLINAASPNMPPLSPPKFTA